MRTRSPAGAPLSELWPMIKSGRGPLGGHGAPDTPYDGPPGVKHPFRKSLAASMNAPVRPTSPQEDLLSSYVERSDFFRVYMRGILQGIELFEMLGAPNQDAITAGPP